MELMAFSLFIVLKYARNANEMHIYKYFLVDKKITNSNYSTCVFELNI